MEENTRCIILRVPDEWPIWRLDYLLRIALYDAKGEISISNKGSRLKIVGGGVDIVRAVSNMIKLKDPQYKGAELMLRNGSETKWQPLDIPFREESESYQTIYGYGLLSPSEEL